MARAGYGRASGRSNTGRGETLRMGLLYEGAAVEFWEGIVTRARLAAHVR